MDYRLGLFGARSDDGGLGNETFEFYRHMKPAKTVIVDLSSVNGREQHHHRYSEISQQGQEITIVQGFPTRKDCEKFLNNIDVVICYEIPYNYDLFRIARERGIKTILRYNYEFLDYLQQPNLPLPDLLVSPSLWHLEDVEAKFEGRVEVKWLNNPVARDRLPFREIDQMKTFVHIAGVKLHEDRNGTDLVTAAIPMVKNKDIKFIIYSQANRNWPESITSDTRVEIRELNAPNYWDLYKEGDCLLLPRRYGGQTLQLNEAMSCGMIPIMLNCPPNFTMVRNESLIPVFTSKKIMTRTEIDCYDAHPAQLADKIDEFSDLLPQEVRALNQRSDHYAELISWESMAWQYHRLFEDITCTSQS